jgi:subtilisin family serine protease
MSGAAPGAKLVSVRACLFVAGCTAHALIEGMIYAVKSAHVDVINMSIGDCRHSTTATTLVPSSTTA